MLYAMDGGADPHLPSPVDVLALRAARRTLARVVPCRHSAEQLWPYITQVDLYNRASGASPVEYEIVPTPESASVIRATSRKIGVAMRYQELPYEWQQPRFVHGELFFESGPFLYGRIRGEYLEDQPAVRYVVDYVPRHRFGLAGLLARHILKTFVAIVRGIDERLPDTFTDPLGVKGFEDRSAAARRRATDLAGRWRHLAPDAVVADAVADFVMTAPDRFVGRMRPYGLAQQLGTSRGETLVFCLRAAQAGFLDTSWDLICPSCGGAKHRRPTLSELGDTAHCDVCNVRYDADFAHNVELSFRPVPSLRTLDEDEYCLQSPEHQRQILAQVNVEPGARTRLVLSLGPGHYRLRCIGHEGEALFNAAYGRARETVTITLGGGVPRSEHACGSVLELLLENDGGGWRTIRFERHGYREEAASAAAVLALPEFRGILGGESSLREHVARLGVP